MTMTDAQWRGAGAAGGGVPPQGQNASAPPAQDNRGDDLEAPVGAPHRVAGHRYALREDGHLVCWRALSRRGPGLGQARLNLGRLAGQGLDDAEPSLLRAPRHVDLEFPDPLTHERL